MGSFLFLTSVEVRVQRNDRFDKVVEYQTNALAHSLDNGDMSLLDLFYISCTGTL